MNKLDAAFKAFVESAPVLCLAADRDFITIYVNPFYEHVHNVTLEQAVGKHIKDIIGEEGFQDNLEYYNQALEGNIVVRDGSFNKLDGSIHHYKATYAPIYDGKQVVGITGVVLDTTSEVEMVKTNKQLEKTKSELKTLVALDPLTNLYNRRYFSGISKTTFNTSKRNKSELSFVILDIDHFKQVNDTYGHDVGDQVLIKLSKLLSTSLRKSDVLCRYGGEEFLIMLPDTNVERACLISDKIRQRINELSIKPTEKQKFNFTVSFGVSSINCEQDNSVESVICRADKALYKAKEGGRNRVEFIV
ncbi:sensor domain-containing diguanylate cyclase [Planctobacterium marinum]